MPSTFHCKEINLSGQVIEQAYRGDSREEVLQIIRSKGHRPVKIVEQKEQGQAVSEIKIFQPKVKVKDISIFCKQLYTMLQAGMPLITALDVLSAQSENKTLKSVLAQMLIQVQKGDVLSTAMRAHPKVFPVLLVNMVEAGELTGNLDGVLERMSEHYTKENKINSKIKGAMMYPMILGILALTVVFFMLTFVLPTFVGMFVGSGVDLPGPTQFVMNLSEALQNYWYLFLGGIFAFVAGIKAILATYKGKLFFDGLKLKLPGVGPAVAKIATSRFTRTLSTLMASGIPIIQAIESSAKVTGNQVVMDRMEDVVEDIKKGSAFSVLLKNVGVFPPMMISMVSIGEESGSLESMLEKTADFYDEELENAIQKLISIMEPMMIIFMALIIGFIVIAMLLPMFEMFQTI